MLIYIEHLESLRKYKKAIQHHLPLPSQVFNHGSYL